MARYTINAEKPTGDADDDQRLGSEKGEDDSAQDRGQKNLVHPEALIGLLKHIQRESQGRQDAAGQVSKPCLFEALRRNTEYETENKRDNSGPYFAKNIYTVAGTIR
jgi:hypothetical protein